LDLGGPEMMGILLDMLLLWMVGPDIFRLLTLVAGIWTVELLIIGFAES
jgi:hypothetical protein